MTMNIHFVYEINVGTMIHLVVLVAILAYSTRRLLKRADRMESNLKKFWSTETNTPEDK